MGVRVQEDPPDTPENPETPQFEGREVPREPSGRVSRKAKVPEGETIGTPEQIAMLTRKIANLKAKIPYGPMDRALVSSLTMTRCRLMRSRKRHRADKMKLRLIKAQSAEKVARRTIEEAAAAVDGTAKVLGQAISKFGKVAIEDLAPYLSQQLKSEDENERREAAKNLVDITKAVFDLGKRGADQKRKAEKVIASWPEEGAKS
jgi:ribosomal protein S15P/S13E